jgi:RNA polymerase sigma factor (sigma-70 family)
MDFNEAYREVKEMRTWCKDEETETAFLNRYQRIILKLANRAIRIGVRETIEELVQKGVLGLLTAKERYASYISSGRKVKFNTYAYNWIMAVMHGDTSADSSAVSLDDSINGTNGTEEDGLTLHDLLPSQEPTADRQLEDRELWQAVTVLPPKQRLVITLRYKEGMTLAETGERIGCSKQNAQVIETKALQALRKRFSVKFPLKAA